MERYLKLFEQIIKKQEKIVGHDIALAQAKKAGLSVSKEGYIVSCAGNPEVVLLRLIKFFTKSGNMSALVECTPLINELLKRYNDNAEESETIEPEKLGK
ncbi:MAG: hypothetical protein GXO93_06065 [FCB group bacterium]|nr:hypothetical protein [FCB group bacterium]